MSVTVAASHGMLLLPSIGAVAIPDGIDGLGAAIVSAGRLSVDFGRGPIMVDFSRHPAPLVSARRLVLETVEFDVEFDDLDPRVLPTAARARRLSDPEFQRWRRRTEAAWRLLTNRHPGHRDALAGTWRSITPQLADRGVVVSRSAADLPGHVALSLPRDHRFLAATLIHEARHNELNLIQEVASFIHTDDDPAVHYSPWRPDPRPAVGILHAVFAFTAVAEFWRTEHAATGRTDAAYEYSLLRLQIRAALDELIHSGRLTHVGRFFAGEVDAQLDRWTVDPVAELPLNLSLVIAVDHRQRWRLGRELPSASVHRLTDAWLTGAEPPPLPTPGIATAGPDRNSLARRPHLARRLLRRVANWPSGPDGQLLRGEPTAAAAGFAAQIASGRSAVEDWAGIATCACLDGRADGIALRLRPELVRAVFERARHLTGRTPELGTLLRWLSHASWTPEPGIHR